MILLRVGTDIVTYKDDQFQIIPTLQDPITQSEFEEHGIEPYVFNGITEEEWALFKQDFNAQTFTVIVFTTYVDEPELVYNINSKAMLGLDFFGVAGHQIPLDFQASVWSSLPMDFKAQMRDEANLILGFTARGGGESGIGVDFRAQMQDEANLALDFDVQGSGESGVEVDFKAQMRDEANLALDFDARGAKDVDLLLEFEGVPISEFLVEFTATGVGSSDFSLEYDALQRYTSDFVTEFIAQTRTSSDIRLDFEALSYSDFALDFKAQTRDKANLVLNFDAQRSMNGVGEFLISFTPRQTSSAEVSLEFEAMPAKSFGIEFTAQGHEVLDITLEWEALQRYFSDLSLEWEAVEGGVEGAVPTVVLHESGCLKVLDAGVLVWGILITDTDDALLEQVVLRRVEDSDGFGCDWKSHFGLK